MKQEKVLKSVCVRAMCLEILHRKLTPAKWMITIHVDSEHEQANHRQMLPFRVHPCVFVSQ